MIFSSTNQILKLPLLREINVGMVVNLSNLTKPIPSFYFLNNFIIQKEFKCHHFVGLFKLIKEI